MREPRRAVLWTTIVTLHELQTEPTFANTLGGVVGHGRVIAGDPQCLDGTRVRRATEAELARYYASALEQIGLTELPLRTDGINKPMILNEWDRWQWAIGEFRRRLRTDERTPESFEAWEQRRLTRLAIVGAEQVARLIASTENHIPTGLAHLEAQIASIGEQHPENEPWRLEALARATRPKPGATPREIAPGNHEALAEWSARVEASLHGIAWWLQFSGRHAGDLRRTMAEPEAEEATQRWITGSIAQSQNRLLQPRIRDALLTIETRIPRHRV